MSVDINLHPKQKSVLLSEATEILYGGAAGGGKSLLLRALAILFASQIPGINVYLFRRISEDLIESHFTGHSGFEEMLAPWVECGFCRITYAPARIRFSNGSQILGSHCQYEKHLVKYQGAEIDVLLIDELTHFTEKQYRYLRGRCRTPNDPKIQNGIKKLAEKLGVKIVLPFIVCASNPGGVGHGWVKQTFIDSAPPKKIHKTGKDDGSMLRQFIPAKLSDNPSLDEEEYKGKLAGLGDENLVRAMLNGDWNIAEGAYFADCWKNNVNVVNPFPISKGWYIDRSFDWGSSKPFAVCWFAESDGCDIKLKDGTVKNTCRGDVFFFAEYYGWNGKANEGCRMLASDIARKIKHIEERFPFPVKPGPADSAIWTNENGNCIADDMSAQGVKWLKANKGPGSRIQGWQIMRRYLSDAKSAEKPGLYVFNTCRHFIRTVPVVPRDDRNPEDIDTDAEDHILDAVRYRLLAKKSIVKTGRVRGLGG